MIQLSHQYLLQDICDHLQVCGRPMTAVAIKRALKMTNEDFDEAATYGDDAGFLKWEAYNYITLLKMFRVQERAFYEPVKNAISALWLKDGYKPHEFHLRVTANDDSKIVGPWTRPDLTLVSHRKFAWTVGNEFDVVTFEVKRPAELNVLAVFEALSHVSAATKAYAVFPIDFDDWGKTYPEQKKRVQDECIRHGVGLITIKSPEIEPKAKIQIAAVRREIDHRKCSDFLDSVMPNEIKSEIATWKN